MSVLCSKLFFCFFKPTFSVLLVITFTKICIFYCFVFKRNNENNFSESAPDLSALYFPLPILNLPICPKDYDAGAVAV